MPETKECPLCGGTMRLKQIGHVVRIPGNPEPDVKTSTEWSCPDCDYFEEAEEENT